jgi:hypothetical protein
MIKPTLSLRSIALPTSIKNQVYNKIVTWTAILGTMLILGTSCSGQDADTNSSQPHFPGQAPGEKQAILRQIEGTVSAINTPRTTLTIKSADGEHTFKLTSKTKFTRSGTPAAINDIAVGKPVQVVVKMVYGEPDEIVKVEINPPSKP